MESLGFDLQREASLRMLTHDVVKSSAIEGEKLNPEEVRSSLARRMGLELGGLVPSSRDVEGVVEMLLDATQNYNQPLTHERLFGWHAAIFPGGSSGMHRITVGTWRTPETGKMRVVSGRVGKETVHFEAPEAGRLEGEMQHFLEWFNADQPLDAVLKAGLAHFWFVTLHPFEDGNGRIARAVGDMGLARADGTSERFYSLSAQIEAERSAYYEQLERHQRGGLDVTGWLDWFLDCLGRAVVNAETTLAQVLYKAQLWESLREHPVNARQRSVLTRMLEPDFVGHMNTSKYARMTKCSNDTALRDIQDLKKRGLFVQNPGGGRSTSYRLAKG